MVGFTHSGTAHDWQGPRVQSCRCSQWGCGAITARIVLSYPGTLSLLRLVSEGRTRSL